MTAIAGLMAFLLFSSATLGALPAYADAPSAPVRPSHDVTLTAYNAVPEQTDSDPFTTASGAYSNPEVVAARSRDLKEELPFGTIIEVSGPSDSSNSCGYHVVAEAIGYRVIADTMNARYTDRIDILFSTKANYILNDGSTKNAGTILGICPESSVRVVGFVDISNPGNLPETQEELAALVHETKSPIALE
jgi:3D (Asp-Asp-Asp) domain-containing protein